MIAHSSRSFLAALALPAMLACGRHVPTDEQPASTGGFVVTLGNDTVSAESFTRSGNRIEGIVVRRVPRTAVVRYRMTLAPSGLASRLDYRTRLPDDRLVPGGADSVSVTFTPDSAITRIMRDTVTTLRAAIRNGYPEIDGAVSLYGLPIAALDHMGADSARFTSYPAGGQQGGATPVARRGANNYALYSFGSPIAIATNASGEIVSVDATQTTFRVRSQRQPAVDVMALAREFARREAVAGPVAALSLRDTARATVGGARITVDYGRPALRGRRVWGPNGVLGDTLWRTGANQATRLETSAPLYIGGQTLPAGTYTLMTLAVPGRYQLLFLEANAERLRVPLQSSTLPSTVERFTIVIDSTGERTGVLRLRWDTLELAAPFEVR